MNLSLSSYVHFHSDLSDKDLCFLVDTGASISLIRRDRMFTDVRINPHYSASISGITDEVISTLGTVKSKLFAQGAQFSHIFQVVDENFPIPIDGILGLDFISQFRASIDYDQWKLLLHPFKYDNFTVSQKLYMHPKLHTVLLPPRAETIRPISLNTEQKYVYVPDQEIAPNVLIGRAIVPSQNAFVYVLNYNNTVVSLNKPTIRYESLENFNIFDMNITGDEHKEKVMKALRKNFPKQVQDQLEKLCLEFVDIFATSGDPVRPNNFYTQKIRLKDDTPTFIKNYRTPYADKDEMNRQVRKLIEDDYIEPSNSEYGNPILLVPKKALPGSDKKRWRLVIDFRQLNKKLASDKFPLPRIDEILDRMGNARYFTVLDLVSGFHQIELESNSRDCTSFSTDSGSYRFKRLPFGLKIAPNSFQRMMNLAFAGIMPERGFIYLDDAVLTATNEKEMFETLRKVFERCRERRLTLNAEKCVFFRPEVTYLGHKCTNEGIYPDDSKYSVIQNFPKPENKDEVRRFVAFCNYYRRFVPNFAELTNPLTNLTKKKIKFEWNKECQRSFEKLKKILLSPTILKYPDFTKEFCIMTDASDKACGAVLCQQQGDIYMPVAYASRNFTKGERNKATIEKELAAIHWAIIHFRPYLYGRKFLVKSDHKPLVYLFSMTNPSSKLTRMRLDLEEYDFEIEYIKGKDNVAADALSRVHINDLKMMLCKIMTILPVQTRNMKKKAAAQKKNETNNENNNEHTHIGVYETLKSGYPTLIMNNNNELIILNRRGRPLIKIHIKDLIVRGKLQLPAVLSRIEVETGNLSLDTLYLKKDDDIFNYCSIEELKAAARVLKTLKIALTNALVHITDLSEQKSLIEQFHNDPLRGGHSGIKRTLMKLRQFYKWKNMSKQVHIYVKSCKSCQLNKVHKSNKIPLCETRTPCKPFEMVQIDTQGKLPITENGNQYIVTIICDLTKYLIAVPTPTKDAKTVAKAIFEHLIMIYGPPKTILTDCGTEYRNQVMTELTNLLDIRHDFSTPYHHRTMGTVEKSHRTFNEYLRSYLNLGVNQWDEMLAYFCYCYNTTPSIAHDFTPFELVFGRLPPNFDLLNQPIEPIYNCESYVKELKFRLQNAHERAKRMLQKLKSVRKQLYDEQSEVRYDFKVNDLVLVKNETNHKFQRLYDGPYKITNMDEFNCTLIDEKQRERIMHRDLIIPFHAT